MTFNSFSPEDLEDTMISREDLLIAMEHETKVCKHLYTKIPEGGMEYRPTEGQRTTLELLRYLTTCAIGIIIWHTDRDSEKSKQYDEEAKNMRPNEFPGMMDKQLERIREALAGIDDDRMDSKAQIPGAGEGTLGAALMRTSYAWLVAYRMQLFLYIKAAGNDEIGTVNNWAGIDYTPKEEKQEEETT